MKVLMINGSPRKGGNTSMALNEMVKIFDAEGIESEIVEIGGMDIPGCAACYSCLEGDGGCVYGDIVNEISKKFEEADGLVLATPVYYSSPNGTLIALLDRLFLSSRFSKSMKVGASLSVARRAGVISSLEVLDKYFSISSMPIATSDYWNGVYGRNKGEILEDKEGLRTLHVLAQNMAFLMKSIALGKKEYGLPEYEKKAMTNFIR